MQPRGWTVAKSTETVPAEAVARLPAQRQRATCWDSAVAESFFGTLKNELIHRRPWSTREATRDAIGEYIEIFDNRIRRHSAIGGMSPAKFEEMAQIKEVRAA
jgi:putative transposase